ncbi:shikimate dehydrogenase [Candidatus Protofrankia datiscae]|uniref:Shikimate dehydrogenase n=2 Tax=Protofrankia TaxID=2994361 RepID=F8AV57_9ACTN|nr:shikimate dehydrogenase [Candidatus Protofrankia datiscae]AEH10633.1 Shikimate dehydrogenase [Candidatus Protofrankia datiscae]
MTARGHRPPAAVESHRPRAAVAGMPIAHSLSPVMHHAAYRALGIDWDYTAVACDDSAIGDLIARVRTEPGWVGLSLTMPLKRAVLAFLDRIDDTAAAVGAVNTVVVERDGQRDTGGDVRRDTGRGTATGGGADRASTGNTRGLITESAGGGDAGPVRLAGFNTDVAGTAHAVTTVLGNGRAPRSPLVIGAGGTARAVLAALAALGAERADVLARRPPAAAPLAEIGTALGLAVTVHRWDTTGTGPAAPTPQAKPSDLADLADLLAAADVVLATTPAGATDELARRPWPASTALVELLYHPWPTRLAAAAQAAGAPVAGGLVVLAAQAVGQVRLFTGAEVDVDLLLTAGEAALAAR